MSKARHDLVGLGECMVELYASQPLSDAATLTSAYGGDVLNALVAAARLGARTGFISRVGNDPFGAGLLRAWQEQGVDTAQAPLVDGENGVYFISLSDAGEREFTYRRHASAASMIAPEQLDAEYIAGARCLLLSGITQALSDSARHATLAAARIAHAHGVALAYDPNYRPTLWARRGGLDAARAAMAELLPYTTLLLPSYPADAELLAQQPRDAAGAALAFAALGPEVAQKCGSGGCHLARHDQVQHLPAVPVPKVIDSTGAGDAWNGSFLHHWLQGLARHDAALAAHATAARKLGHRGAIPPAISLQGQA